MFIKTYTPDEVIIKELADFIFQVSLFLSDVNQLLDFCDFLL